MQALPLVLDEEIGPLTPSPIFDSLIEYKIFGRGTCNPVAVIDGYMGEDLTHLVFTVSEMLFEVAKRDMVGDSTLIAAIIVEDLKKNRQCSCHLHGGPTNTSTPIITPNESHEDNPVHYFAPVTLGSAP